MLDSLERELYSRERIKSQKGITIVALVITIIILIILSTVTISVILGDNGLIEQAKKTKNIAEGSIESETKELNEVEKEYANYMATNKEIEQIKTVVDYKENGEVFDDTKTIYDEKGNEITVPEGFKIASDSGDTLQQGVVIEDVNASADTAVQGSQFVWIPVGKFIKDDGEPSNEIILGRYIFSTTSPGTPTLEQAAYTDENPENYKESKVIDSFYDEYSGVHRDGAASSGLDGLNATANDLDAWINSVKENGGYYIGRYEASYASGSSVENYKATTKVSEYNSTSSMSYNPGTLWNYITQLEASKVAINTYKESTSVKSDLINSYAWDTAIVYIQECGNTNYANQKGTDINTNLTNTGTGQDEVCKINDMASNIREWTTESSYYTASDFAYPCTFRGGDYDIDFIHTAYRNVDYAISSNSFIGFRLSLYM